MLAAWQWLFVWYYDLMQAVNAHCMAGTNSNVANEHTHEFREYISIFRSLELNWILLLPEFIWAFGSVLIF